MPTPSHQRICCTGMLPILLLAGMQDQRFDYACTVRRKQPRRTTFHRPTDARLTVVPDSAAMTVELQSQQACQLLRENRETMPWRPLKISIHMDSHELGSLSGTGCSKDGHRGTTGKPLVHGLEAFLPSAVSTSRVQIGSRILHPCPMNQIYST